MKVSAEQNLSQLKKPPPDLADRIEISCIREGRVGLGRSFFEVLPDSGVSLVFRLSPRGSRLVLMGQATEQASIEVDETADYFYMRFHPANVPLLGDIHPAELIDAHVDLPRLQGFSIDSLADYLLSLPDPASRHRVMEGLMRQAPPLIRAPRCRQAISLLQSSRGQLPIHIIASGMGMHLRSLERLFKDSLGMSPKRFARLVRLRHLADRLRIGRFETLTDLAYTCGYADQSHMIKDFKSLTGRLPKEPSAGDMRRLEGPPRTRIIHCYRPR